MTNTMRKIRKAWQKRLLPFTKAPDSVLKLKFVLQYVNEPAVDTGGEKVVLL